MRRALLSLVPSGVLGIAASAVWASDSWARVGVPLGARHFGDLNVILAAAECAGRDLSWSAAVPSCQEAMSFYNYPSLWGQAFGLVGAGQSWTPWIAVFLSVIVLIALVPLTWLALGTPAPFSRAAAMTVAAVMPPMWLAFERGNIDQFVFGLIVLALVLWVRGATTSSGVVIGIAGALKVFPFGAALMLLSPSRTRRNSIVAFAITSVVGLAVIARDLPIISARTPQIDGASFGIGLLPLLLSNRFDLEAGVGYSRVAGLLLFAVAFAILFLLTRGSSPSRLSDSWVRLCGELRSDHIAGAAVLAGGGAFLVAYLLGPSYDYRLIFLIPVIAGLLRIGTIAAWVAAGLALVPLVLSYSQYVGAAEYLSDLMLLVTAPALAVTAFRLVRTPA